jgi:uncharacterized protein (TIGR02145 family)
MKQMKKFQLFAMFSALFFYCFSFQVKAQEIMNIQKKDKSVISIPVSEIEMITFSGSRIANESTVKDIEGNVYKTVQIGRQVWMAENLKTKTFNNGSPIQLVTDNKDWNNMTTPAYCWLNNDESTYKNKYGALYNWYTVNTKNLCPSGWHVSTDNDWQELEKYLIETEKQQFTGKILASNFGWVSSNSPTSVGSEMLPEYRNKSGFTALPGGFRAVGFGNPIDIGGYWWTSKEESVSHAWFKMIINYLGTVEEVARPKYYGCSVRCVKND